MNCLQAMLKAFCVILLIGAVALGATCPLCGVDISSSEKYCVRHKADAAIKTAADEEEAKVVDDLVTARRQYVASLENLKKFYEQRGNAKKLGKVEKELSDVQAARQFTYVYWEDRLPTEPMATTSDPDADKLLVEADKMRNGNNPFTKAQRYRDAALKYRDIILNYPKSTAVDDAAFGLGDIYSSGAIEESAVEEYERAIRYYEIAYLANPTAMGKALYRTARVYEKDLSDYENAAKNYWMAAQYGGADSLKKKCAKRLKQLQAKNFGIDYQLPEPIAKPADAGEQGEDLK